jgi:hypothetical protein
MRRIYLSAAFLVLLLLSLMVDALHAAVVYPLEVFTDNGGYHDSPEMDLYVEVVDRGSRVDFIFHNESLIDCSMARIYFQGGAFFGIADIIDGPGTSFGQPATPAHLPAGNLLEPPFVTTHELSFDSDPPAPQNGINPGEWVMTTFDLINSGTFQSVVDELNTGALRIGVHIIALPDGSSESAIAVPEPTMLCLLGLGALALLRKRSN